jgi:nucleoside-diphosphate-sugar epimerase
VSELAGKRIVVTGDAGFLGSFVVEACNCDPKGSHVIPAMIREPMYVEGAAEALVLAPERYASSKPVNIGSRVEISIRDLAQQVARATACAGVEWARAQPAAGKL